MIWYSLSCFNFSWSKEGVDQTQERRTSLGDSSSWTEAPWSLCSPAQTWWPIFTRARWPERRCAPWADRRAGALYGWCLKWNTHKQFYGFVIWVCGHWWERNNTWVKSVYYMLGKQQLTTSGIVNNTSLTHRVWLQFLHNV